MLQQRFHVLQPRKGRGTRDQIANIHWIIEKPREFQKNIYFYFIDYIKAFSTVDHNKLWKILKDMVVKDHLIYLQRNIYFCFNDYAKAFDCVDHNKLWKILQVMGIPDLPPAKSVCRSKSNS